MHEIGGIECQIQDPARKKVRLRLSQKFAVIGIVFADVADDGVLRFVVAIERGLLCAFRIFETAYLIPFGAARFCRNVADDAKNEVSALMRRGIGEECGDIGWRDHARSQPCEIQREVEQEHKNFGREKGAYGNLQGRCALFPLFRAHGKEGIEHAEYRHGIHEPADEGRKSYLHAGIGVIVVRTGQKEHRIQANADLNGGRDIQAVPFLHEHGQAHKSQFKGGKNGIADERIDGTAPRRHIGGNGAREHEQEECRAKNIYDSRRFFSEYFFEHGGIKSIFQAEQIIGRNVIQFT